MFKANLKRVATITPFLLLSAVAVFSKDLSYKVIYLENISRYNEDRIFFQHIENETNAKDSQQKDPSLATLLIIKDKKMYLFKDGYDDSNTVEQNIIPSQTGNQQNMNNTWVRSIDGKPDYLRITDRRVELLKKEILPSKNENLTQRYSDFYIKIRNNFIKKHALIFKGLMLNRKDSGLQVIRKLIPKKTDDKGPLKYFVSVTGKIPATGEVYYAEDADGDGYTETFTVQLADGFHWGYKSGANILCIYKNTHEDIRGLIGAFTKNAYEGTPEEDVIIDNQFDLLDKEIPILMDDLMHLDNESKRILEEGTKK